MVIPVLIAKPRGVGGKGTGMTEAADKGGAADRAEPGDHRAPGHEKNPQRPRSAIGPYAQVIDEWLLADRNAAQARHAARRIWQPLIAEHGAALAEVTVSRYVAPAAAPSLTWTRYRSRCRQRICQALSRGGLSLVPALHSIMFVAVKGSARRGRRSARPAFGTHMDVPDHFRCKFNL
jgi:hypothetical protein